ncbi:hypothetical protein J132_01206 [Termitomyces sp. J132]|nr:hypothetical protein J132_01206 [Termitomyces sp. J132]
MKTSLLDPFKATSVRQSPNPFTHPIDSSKDGVLVTLEEEGAMREYSFRDPDVKSILSSGSYTAELWVKFAAADIFSPQASENRSSIKESSSLAATLVAVETRAPSAAKSVSFEPHLELIDGVLSTWAYGSIKKYQDGDVLYRRRIQEHHIVEWRRYRVQLRDRDFSGGRHEYIIVKIEHPRSKETFIRFERWMRDKYYTFGGRSGHTLDWSPELDQVTILEDWMVDRDTDTLVDKRVFNEDQFQFDLLDLFIVARSILQIPGNCFELARRSSHWFAVIFSNVLDHDVDQIKRKYNHKRRKLDITGWLRESSREERDYALKLIYEFRGDLCVKRAEYRAGEFVIY